MTKLLPLMVLAVLGLLFLPAEREPEPTGPRLTGQAVVVDGDTLTLGRTKIRLHGIDAPEARQTCSDRTGRAYRCGERATRALSSLIGGQPVTCEGRERDRYGRLVATCSAGGTDLNGSMVSAGWALAYRRYATDFVGAEDQARRARRGIWEGAFTPPWDWRHAGGAASPNEGRVISAGKTTGRRCAIKGNISENGLIYHVPGSEHYERTRISEARGERWFCSEAEAIAAGWRPPGG